MKDIYKIALIVLVTILATIGVKYWLDNREKPKPTINYGQLIERNAIELVQQTNSYADVSGTYKFRIFGSTKVFCKWDATIRFGIDVPDSFEWKITYKDGIWEALSPPLTVLNVNVGATECKKIKNGLGVDEMQFRNKLEKEFETYGIKTANELLFSKEVIKLSRLSLENHLKGILSQANPKLDTKGVIIIFSGEPQPMKIDNKEVK